MSKGFVFKKDYCTGCNACNAACLLENRWDLSVRTIYRYNSKVVPSLPVFNLSLACNHCTNAVCMDGCPSGAYTRDKITNAVIADSEKCLGCSYCIWNCPYEAPKMRISEQTIQKCNLCNELISTGGTPACASACPTGALSFDTFDENSGIIENPGWFPEKNLEPRLLLLAGKPELPVEVIPPGTFYNEPPAKIAAPAKNIASEWSLIAFSYLIMLSVAMQLDFLLTGNQQYLPVFAVSTLLPGFISVFHLGKISRAWRAVSKLSTSPLSREILVYLIYIVLTILSFMTGIGWLALIASISGILLLLAIDSVYSYSDSKSWYSSGATFISGLLVASFLADLLIPFLFIALIKAAMLIYTIMTRKQQGSVLFPLRFTRTALLILTAAAILSGVNADQKIICFVFLAGELADRMLFYFDFDPLNINDTLDHKTSTA